MIFEKKWCIRNISGDANECGLWPADLNWKRETQTLHLEKLAAELLANQFEYFLLLVYS
jgi:hypothetical protein